MGWIQRALVVVPLLLISDGAIADPYVRRCTVRLMNSQAFALLLLQPLDKPGQSERLIDAAERRFKAFDVLYKREVREGNPVLVLLPEGDAALNRLARNLREQEIVHEFVYDPVRLRRSGAKASFASRRHRQSATVVYLPAATPIDPSNLRELSLGHEVWHAKIEQEVRQGRASAFQGVLKLKRGDSLPGGSSKFYAQFMHVDEVKAYSVSTHERLEQLYQATFQSASEARDLAKLRMSLTSDAEKLSLSASRVSEVSAVIADLIDKIRSGLRPYRDQTFRFESPPRDLRIDFVDGDLLGPDLKGRVFAIMQVREYGEGGAKSLLREYEYQIPLASSTKTTDSKNLAALAEALSERVLIGELYAEYSRFAKAFSRVVGGLHEPEQAGEITSELMRILRRRSFDEGDRRFLAFFDRAGPFRRVIQKLPFVPPFVEYFHVATGESITRSMDGSWRP
jgi:hypothetical protein